MLKKIFLTFTSICIMVAAATAAHAALADGKGFFFGPQGSGMTVDFVGQQNATDLGSDDLVVYLPDTTAGTNGTWTDSWGNEGTTNYLNIYNKDDHTLYFINTNKDLTATSGSQAFTMYTWETPEDVQSNVRELGLDWITIGELIFSPDYSGFTVDAFEWEGGLEVKEFTGTFTRETPIPGAIWLLGSGIIGLIGLKRKTRS